MQSGQREKPPSPGCSELTSLNQITRAQVHECHNLDVNLVENLKIEESFPRRITANIAVT